MRVWARVAALSFGGPAGQIAVMHRILVEEKRWVGDAAVPACAQLLHAAAGAGGAAAGDLPRLADARDARRRWSPGALFVLPGFVAMLALSAVYAAFGQTGLVTGVFFGLKAAVLAIVVQAVVRIGAAGAEQPAR